MNKVGILAGIGPASTIEYYWMIIRLFQEKLDTKDYPEMVLHSINMTNMLQYVNSGDEEGLVAFLKDRIKVLENAGADFGVLASNTPHLVFDKLVNVVDLPLISIVEESCKQISADGLKKVGLLGTKSTMSKGFYQRTGSRNNIEILAPPGPDQDFVHDKYMNELVLNKIYPTTKKKLIEIINDLKENQHIEGIILGGTELPLILKQEDFGDFPVFDTTQIHVGSIIDRMIGEV